MINLFDVFIDTSIQIIDLYRSFTIDFGTFSFNAFDASLLLIVFGVIWYHFNGGED